MMPDAAMQSILDGLDMETAARLAGLSIRPKKRFYRCDKCKIVIDSHAKPEDIVGSGGCYCANGRRDFWKQIFSNIIMEKKNGIKQICKFASTYGVQSA